MLRVKGSPEEVVQNLNLRATEALHKARKAVIIQAMKSRPHLVIDPLYEKLQALGSSQDDMDKTTEVAKSSQAQAADKRKLHQQQDASVKKQKLEQKGGQDGVLAEAMAMFS